VVFATGLRFLGPSVHRMLLRNGDVTYAANKVIIGGMCNGLIRRLSVVSAAKIIEPYGLSSAG
jgi:hypothetical protein